jgi:hypothetical protein
MALGMAFEEEIKQRELTRQEVRLCNQGGAHTTVMPNN